VTQLIKEANDGMAKAEQLVDDGNFVAASHELREVERAVTLDDLDEETCDDDRRKAMKALREELSLAQEKVHYSLGQQWDASFSVREEETQPGQKKVSVTAGNKDIDVGSLANALENADMLSYRLGRFSLRLLNLVLKPVIRYKVKIVSDEQSSSLALEYDQDWQQRPSAKSVIGRLNVILDWLIREVGGVLEQGQESLLAKVGGCIAEPFCEYLVEECLVPAVPSKREDLGDFEKSVSAEALALAQLLEQMQFVPDAHATKVALFVSDVGKAFADNRVSMLLAQAREIIKEDLHVTRQVEEFKTMDDEEFAEKLYGKMGIKLDMSETLPALDELGHSQGFSPSDSIFRFPACKVSEHCFRLLDLVQDGLDEACEAGDPRLATRLVTAARLSFELYAGVLPVLHNEALTTLPQHAALALTNTSYLAYRCITMGLAHRKPLEEAGVPSTSTSFDDLVLKLRRSGIDIFQAMLRRQRDELRGMLLEAGSFGRLQGEAQLPPKAEKSLKQVFHSLNRLRNVWQDILPLHIFSRSLGVLSDAVVEELVSRIIGLEDISADVAVQIVTLFKSFEEKLPDVFVAEDGAGGGGTSRHDVVRFVRSWQRFRELIFVLDANLREIEERWASGKGPLAAEFKMEEMKSLIRALFQNTDRRAAVLARIKHE
jgi:centromere/kinetochore protein ZW10